MKLYQTRDVNNVKRIVLAPSKSAAEEKVEEKFGVKVITIFTMIYRGKRVKK